MTSVKRATRRKLLRPLISLIVPPHLLARQAFYGPSLPATDGWLAGPASVPEITGNAYSVLLVAGKRLFSFGGYHGRNDGAIGQLQGFLHCSYFVLIVVKDDGKGRCAHKLSRFEDLSRQSASAIRIDRKCSPQCLVSESASNASDLGS